MERNPTNRGLSAVYIIADAHIIYTHSYCCRQNARPIVNNHKMFISAAARFAMSLVKGDTRVSGIKRRRFANYFRFGKVSL